MLYSLVAIVTEKITRAFTILMKSNIHMHERARTYSHIIKTRDNLYVYNTLLRLLF